MGITLFRLGKFFAIIFLKIFTGPLIWESSLSSIPIILRFDLLSVSCTFWMFLVRSFLHFLWLLCQCFLWYLLHLRFSLQSLISFVFLISSLGFLSRVVSLCDFFIVSISIFRSWMVLFNYFTCLVVFSCNSLRGFCVSSLRASTCLPVHICMSL